MKWVPCQLASAVSMGASVNSSGKELSDSVFYTIQAFWTGGSADGTLKLQTSNDNVAIGTGTNQSAQVVNWNDWTGSSATVSGAGGFTWRLTATGDKWVRVVYTRNGGSGNLTVNFMGKG